MEHATIATSSVARRPLRHDLLTVLVPHGERVHRTALTGAQQTFAVHRFGRAKDHDVFAIEDERVGGSRDAVAEADAQCAIDSHAQTADDALLILVLAHIPSRPSSSRARSMIAGVISAIERSRA